MLRKLAIFTLALLVVSQIYGGVYVTSETGLGKYLIASFVLSVILILLELPIFTLLERVASRTPNLVGVWIMSRMLLHLVINAVALWLTAYFTALEVNGFWGVVVGSILWLVVGMVLDWLFTDVEAAQPEGQTT